MHSVSCVWRCVVTVRVTTLKGTEAGNYYVEALPNYYLDADEPRGRGTATRRGDLHLDGAVADARFSGG